MLYCPVHGGTEKLLVDNGIVSSYLFEILPQLENSSVPIPLSLIKFPAYLDDLPNEGGRAPNRYDSVLRAALLVESTVQVVAPFFRQRKPANSLLGVL